MTTKEFLIKKNEIVKRATGMDLIPLDQIVDEPKVRLSEEDYCITLDSYICPYCMNRKAYEISPIDCDTCPIYVAGNGCGKGESTWFQANSLWINKATDEDVEELILLVQEYNKDIT